MPIRKAEASWDGDLKGGCGQIRIPHVGFEEGYTYASRFQRGEGTNPEELIGAALAGCYSMALAHQLASRELAPKHLETHAKVDLQEQAGGGFKIARIDLDVEGDVPAIGLEGFEEEAERALKACPVAQALAGVDIHVRATLQGQNPPEPGD